MLRSLLSGQLDFTTALLMILAYLVVIFLVLPFHEWAHAYTAMKLGDTSIKGKNRLSLNPVNHIDPIGAGCLILFGFGWAKPVPVDSRYFKNPKVGMAITAAAGPAANIVAAIAGGLIYYALAAFAPATQVVTYIAMFLSFYISVNISLAVFNLIPVPPLDGSKILFGLLPDKYAYKAYAYERYFYIILIVLLFTGILDIPLGFLRNVITDGVLFITRLPFSFFLK